MPFVTQTGQNLSDRYLPYTSGTKVAATGFKFFDVSGNMQDLSDAYSRILTLGWSALGSGVMSTVNAIYAFNTANVYAGGGFTTAGDVSCNSIAKWGYI